MSDDKIRSLETQIGELTQQLRNLQSEQSGVEVKNYTFDTPNGQVSLLDLFSGKNKLLAIHNMGQGCRYCTLWADGINAFLPHLESALSVALFSKDSPELQRKMANSRQWRFTMASHGGGEYQKEQVAGDAMDNAPGIVCYERDGDKILRKSASLFGPGDLYCSMWHLLGVAGIDIPGWTPQYNYWQRPMQMEDGGENLLDA